jgi:hypothetical protein
MRKWPHVCLCVSALDVISIPNFVRAATFLKIFISSALVGIKIDALYPHAVVSLPCAIWHLSPCPYR